MTSLTPVRQLFFGDDVTFAIRRTNPIFANHVSMAINEFNRLLPEETQFRIICWPPLLLQLQRALRKERHMRILLVGRGGQKIAKEVLSSTTDTRHVNIQRITSIKSSVFYAKQSVLLSSTEISDNIHVILDDIIFSGSTIARILSGTEVNTSKDIRIYSLIATEEGVKRISKLGGHVWSAFYMKGRISSYETDLLLASDLLDNEAVKLSDGSYQSYREGDWLEIFFRNVRTAEKVRIRWASLANEYHKIRVAT